jgi:hypothetical protein
MVNVIAPSDVEIGSKPGLVLRRFSDEFATIDADRSVCDGVDADT